MIATMVARLLEGALATATTKAAAADPVVGAVLDGMDPQQPSSPGGVAAQAAVGRGWSSLCCLHAHAVNASQLGGQLRAASVFRRNYCSILIFLLSSSGLGVTD